MEMGTHQPEREHKDRIVDPSDGPQIHVLVIEDDALSLELLKSVLSRKGYCVNCVTNGKQALEFLESHSAPTLILLDSAMPIMNGAKFRQMQLKNPRLAAIPTVLVSAIDDIERRKGILANLDYLSKPINFEKLLSTVGHYCETHDQERSSSVS